MLEDSISLKFSNAVVDLILIFAELVQPHKNLEDNVGIP